MERSFEEQMADTRITKSSGNIFTDIGYPPEEAAWLHLKSTLMCALFKLMQERKLTRRAAAKLFGVPVPRVTSLEKGFMHEFDIESLVEMLTRAGVKVSVRLTNGRKKRVA